MPSIQEDLSSIIKTFAGNSINNTQADDPFTPVLDDKGAPLEPKVETVVPTPKVEAPVVAAKVEPVVLPVTPIVEVKVDELVNPWDEPVQAVVDTTITTAPFDFSEIAKALGKEDIKSKEDVVKAITEVQQVTERFKNVPDDLSRAIEISQLGGNYLEYLDVSQVDWSKEDPIVLYENYVEGQYFDPKTGLVDYEKVDKLLDAKSDEEKEFQGKELQRSYISHQKAQKDQILNQVRANRTNFEQSVRQIVDGLTDVQGYVLTPSKKAELLEFVISGQDLKDSDIKSRVVNAFVKKNFTALDKYMKTQMKNSVTRQILEQAQVPAIQPVSEPVDVTPTKKYGLNDYLEELKKQKGFNN